MAAPTSISDNVQVVAKTHSILEINLFTRAAAVLTKWCSEAKLQEKTTTPPRQGCLLDEGA